MRRKSRVQDKKKINVWARNHIVTNLSHHVFGILREISRLKIPFSLPLAIIAEGN